MFAFAAAIGSASADTDTLADTVRATYLYKFETFVEWPPGTFALPTSPFVLCILGDEAFAALLENTGRGERVGQRGFQVRRVAGATDIAGCQLVYVTAGEEGHAAAVLGAARDAPMLTVTDAADGAKGIINFVLRDNRIRFEIDDAAAARNGLVISSKLLRLAVSMKPRA
jgi:hypothetical protein